jgi:hypothetical protein
LDITAGGRTIILYTYCHHIAISYQQMAVLTTANSHAQLPVTFEKRTGLLLGITVPDNESVAKT